MSMGQFRLELYSVQSSQWNRFNSTKSLTVPSSILIPSMYDIVFNLCHIVLSWSYLLFLFHGRGLEKCLSALSESV